MPAGFTAVDQRTWGDTEVLFARFAGGRPSAWRCPSRIGEVPRALPVSGWIEAGLFVFAIAVLSVTYVVGQQVGAHPIAFILYAMLVSALALLAVTGPGPDALRIMLAPQSWLVGFGIIGMEVFYYLLLEHVAPAHGSLLVRLAIPLSLLVGWVLFARRPRRSRGPGAPSSAPACCRCSSRSTPSTAPRRRRPCSAGASPSTCAASRPSSIPGTATRATVMEKLRVTGLVVLVTSHREPGAGRRLRAAGRAGRAAADPDGADAGADAARADHPARRGGGRHRC